MAIVRRLDLPTLPPIIAERYRPLRLLGRGGGGVVYEVEHVHTGAKLALKALTGFENASAETVSRFQREARLAAAIDSDHVVRITDAGTAPELAGAPFLVMELMHGRTLESEAKAPLAPELVLTLLGQVARALERAHALGIVHRDLKPDNLFITRRDDDSPWVKVLDFGIAKRTGEGSTAQGTVLGTPTYMSPEQAQGQGDRIDARTDTWALGLVTFRLLSGRSYFEPDSMLRMLHRVLFEPLIAPSQLGCRISDAFDAWFLRSCSRELSERYLSATAQVKDLAAVLAGAHVEVDARPEPVAAPRTHDGLISQAGLHALVTGPAQTPPSELAPSSRGSHAQGRAANGVSAPLATKQKQRWFVVGAAIGALLLVSTVALVLSLAERSEPRAGSNGDDEAQTLEAGAAGTPASAGELKQVEPPVSAAPSAPPLRVADAAAPLETREPSGQERVTPEHEKRALRKAKGAAHGPGREQNDEAVYDPLGDQR
jgi:serine/threonine-protein kinase